jgi:chromosome segregation ATPase
VIPEGGDEISGAGERDLLAERRARRAGLDDPVLVDRAQAAEAKVRALEMHLSDLRRQLLEADRERERAAVRLAEHERELLRVKQREYAEQQLRVEAQDDCTRLRRGYRAELHRSERRLQESRAASRSAVRQAEERSARAEQQAADAERRRAELEAQLVLVSESCARLERNIAALQGGIVELRAVLGREREAADLRIVALERALERAEQAGSERAAPASEPAQDEQARREEMAGALAAAVERLRGLADLRSAAAVGDATAPAAADEDTAPSGERVRQPLAPLQPAPAAPVAEHSPHKHSMSLITRLRIRRKLRRERRRAADQPPTIKSQ